MSVWTEPAPAKINLSLHVVGQTPKGYHQLQGLTVFTKLCDELTAREAKKDTLEITGPFAPALVSEKSNIILKAFELFRHHWPKSLPDGLHITLEKMLPVAAGIGGGSADAAAALRMAVRMSEQEIAISELSEIAMELGADVPMCLFSRTCIIGGVGEQIQIVDPFPKLQLVLANPGIAIPTAQIFRQLKSKNNPVMPKLPTQVEHSAALALWLQDTRNDLELPAIEFAPQIAEITREIAQLPGCILSRMSGSGATVFGVFGAELQAMSAAQQLHKLFPKHWVAQTPII
ncbi:4-(cytidine 5'-diphospho)-2-C-methyl-D-erythritol kinase [Maritalea sp.]|jgi:4-diphosphocytidyl-2-C-methyl-D-erythritol kinase|uniref:4-(cytidine 5'-diphospho)-2-C-methyl-D-erythritol kinase n=1 Tax=Maritalea sp. TaxID=2003361 RepID=UPI0039E319B8